MFFGEGNIVVEQEVDSKEYRRVGFVEVGG